MRRRSLLFPPPFRAVEPLLSLLQRPHFQIRNVKKIFKMSSPLPKSSEFEFVRFLDARIAGIL